MRVAIFVPFCVLIGLKQPVPYFKQVHLSSWLKRSEAAQAVLTDSSSGCKELADMPCHLLAAFAFNLVKLC
jgi:hypothetical protein